MKTVLLDTNILIAMEDARKPMPANCADMILRGSGEVGYCYHPKQIEDINCDKDEERRRIVKSRIAQFSCLDCPPEIDIDLYKTQGWSCSKRNDIVDNALLQCVLQPVVNYLVTEDQGMHRKAQKSGIADRVFTIDGFLKYLKKTTTNHDIGNLAVIENRYCRQFSVDDPFFDSLRQDYPSFNAWYDKCCRDQRMCWSVCSDERLRAICIYKTEERPDYSGEVPVIEGKTLKLCTFKVSPELQGTKMGERLLYTAFKYAKENDIGFVYFTVNENTQIHLVNLAESFGFKRLGSYGEDTVFGKQTMAPRNEERRNKDEYLRLYYPSYRKDSSVQKYVVPIAPKWHEQLFPDVADFLNSLFGNDPSFYDSPSQTIRKAYICASSIKTIEPGDLLLFYRSGDRRSIQVIGGVISAERMYDVDLIFERVKNRTVYSPETIGEMLESSRNGLLVIQFDLLEYLDAPVGLDTLRAHGLSHPQSICGINHDCYRELFLKEHL